MDNMRQSVCLVINPIAFNSYGLLNTVGQASYSMTALTYNFNPLIGALFLYLAWPTVAQLEVFFSSDYLGGMRPFLCFIIVC